MTGGRSQGQLDGPWRFASIDGKARGIGATITQSAEHAGNEHAKLRLQVGILEEETHDSTHASYVRVSGFPVAANLAPLDISVNSEAHSFPQRKRGRQAPS